MSKNSRIRNTLVVIRNLIKKDNIEEVESVNPIFETKIEIIEDELNKITTPTSQNYLKIDRLLKLKKFFKSNNQVIDSKRLIVITKTGVNDYCLSYVPIIGECRFADCLVCPNSDYRIMTEDGKIIHDFIYYGNKKSEDIRVDTYVIELPEKIEGNLIEYLIYENSNYRLIRNSDDIVMKPNKEDVDYMHKNDIHVLKYDREEKKVKKYI